MGNRAAHSFGLDANGILSKVFGILSNVFEAFQSRHAPELQAAEIAILADRVQHLRIMNGRLCSGRFKD